MKKNYTPPNQSIFGQMFDTILVLVLVYASLMIPLLFKAEEKAEAAAEAATHAVQSTWESLGQNAVQLHGGMGMTDELPVGHFFKRATVIESELGSTDYHLARYAELSRAV